MKNNIFKNFFKFLANDFMLDDELKCSNYKGNTEKSPLMSNKYFISIMNKFHAFNCGCLALYDPIFLYLN